jgi:hypothetical protein
VAAYLILVNRNARFGPFNFTACRVWASVTTGSGLIFTGSNMYRRAITMLLVTVLCATPSYQVMGIKRTMFARSPQLPSPSYAGSSLELCHVLTSKTSCKTSDNRTLVPNLEVSIIRMDQSWRGRAFSQRGWSLTSLPRLWLATRSLHHRLFYHCNSIHSISGNTSVADNGSVNDERTVPGMRVSWRRTISFHANG